jgi:hypothetical protein
VRSSVVIAAERAETPGDAHLAAALGDLLAAGRRLTRRMLGGEAPEPDEAAEAGADELDPA